MYKLLFKLEGLLLNNSFNDSTLQWMLSYERRLNHLTFCRVNFSRIWELARPKKPQTIIQLQHLFIIVKVFPPFFSVKIRLKHGSIPSLCILSFRTQSSSENERTHSATVNPWKVIWDCSKHRNVPVFKEVV